MRLNGLNLEGMRLNGSQITEARLDGSFVFSGTSSYKQSGLIGLFIGSSNSNTSDQKDTFKNLGSGPNASLYRFGYSGNSGWTGSSLYFDGVDDLVGTVKTIGSFNEVSELILPGNVYTLECVFRRPAVRQATCPITNFVFNGTNGVKGLSFGASADGAGERFVLNHGNVIYDYIGNSTTGAYNLNTIYSVSVSFDTVNKLFYCYINGNLILTKADPTFIANNTIMLGRWSTTNTSYMFHGEIFCARVYNRFITADEVQYNFNIDKVVYGI